MGVPRFFRWITERWPCVYTTVTTDTAPPTDNLFMNLNSVLHDVAVHSGGHGDTDVILKHIEDTIEKLVKAIKPKTLLFFAIDGVLPKAKLNLHRSNKFRIAENMKLASAAATRRGEVLKTFDLNALTTGTEFMGVLMKRLKSFVRRKISQDVSWSPTVILSGSDVPGEADHKILDYIRNAKHSTSWIANQRHCFYGLDAASLISALVIHEPHCYLFKEKSTRSKGSKGPAARIMLENKRQDEFIMCSIGLLRDYLQIEIGSQIQFSFSFDLERTIDDFVLLCILAGNDFLPGLECFDGADVLLENLMESYKAMLPYLGGYITQIGRIDGKRLQMVLDHCSRSEEERIAERLHVMLQNKPMDREQFIDQDFLFVTNRAARDIFNAFLSPENAMRAWKDRHYQEKLEIPPEEKHVIVTQYFEGLSWAMRCFYRGLPSWNWSYPYHYAPMLSDMKNMDPSKVLFKMGNPVSPLFHLMSVIPRASHKLVPTVLQRWMIDPQSPLSPFYPNDCRVDMEGKRMDWEAVVLLPLLDEKTLANALSRVTPAKLSKSEQDRIKTECALIFTTQDGLIKVHFWVADPSTAKDLNLTQIPISRTSDSSDICSLNSLKFFRSELPRGTLTRNESPAGYWSLHSLKANLSKSNLWKTLLQVSAALRKMKVCLYNYASERYTLQLSLPSARLQVDPSTLVGRIAYVDWPSLCKARIVHVDIGTSDSRMGYEDWKSHVDAITNDLRGRKGIEVGRIDVLVTVKKIIGTLREGLDNIIEKYGSEEIFPLQAILLENVYSQHDSDLERGQRIDVSPHDRLLYMGGKQPGVLATVRDNHTSFISSSSLPLPNELEGDDQSSVRPEDAGLAVCIQDYSARSWSTIRKTQNLLRSCYETYHPSGAVASQLGVSPQGLSRITGSLWVNTGSDRYEIGLAVKLGSKNMCVPGYVRSSPNGTGWEYTEALITILRNYKKACHWVFEAVDATPEGGEINLPHVFPEVETSDLNDMVHRTKQWLKELPLMGRPLVTAEAQVGSLSAIEQAYTIFSSAVTFLNPVEEFVPRSLLIPPSERSSIPSKEAGGDMSIGDLVIYMGSNLIGFGSPGVVIGTLDDQVEVLFSSRVLHSNSIFGDSTQQNSCLVDVAELINISRFKGEERTKINHQTAKSMSPVPRTKNGSMNRSRGQQGNQRRRRKQVWHEREQVHSYNLSPFHPPSPCTFRPVMAVPAFGSGVFIPGMTPLPSPTVQSLPSHSFLGIPGSMPSHPMQYINYSLTPRY